MSPLKRYCPFITHSVPHSVCVPREFSVCTNYHSDQALSVWGGGSKRAQMNSQVCQTQRISVVVSETWWEIYWKTIIIAIFFFNKELIRRVFIHRHCPPLMTGVHGKCFIITSTHEKYEWTCCPQQRLKMAGGENAWPFTHILLASICMQMCDYTCALTCHWKNQYSYDSALLGFIFHFMR